MRGLIAFFIRATAFTGKELAEVIRQPRLALTLIIGPFLILLLFGAGYREEGQPRRTLFVAAEDNPVRDRIEEFAEQIGPQIVFVGATADEGRARSRLRQGEVDLVVILPPDPYEQVRGNEKATFTVLHDQINPMQADFVRRLGDVYVGELNRDVQRLVSEEAQGRMNELEDDVEDARNLAIILNRALGEGPLADRAGELARELDFIHSRMQEVQQVEPDVIVEPFLTETESVARVSPSLADYFTPAVIALLLQHMAVTFAGLSIVRDGRVGAMELYRVSPISALEVLIGKYLAYLLLGLVVAAVLTLAVVYGLGVALLGGWAAFAVVALGLLFASLGFGFLISLVSQNENQAVQYSMLVLLVSVFFSGFLVILSALVEPIRYISYGLPVTYGIHLLRNVMFRGELIDWGYVGILYGMGLALVIVSWLVLRRRMATR